MMRPHRSDLKSCMACMLTLLFGGLLQSGEAGELGQPWDELVFAGTGSRSSIQISRARILRDDVATLDKDQLLISDHSKNHRSIESMAKESREIETNQVHAGYGSVSVTPNEYNRRLQLALSADSDANAVSTPPCSLSLNVPSSLAPKSSLRSTGTTIVGCLVEEGRYAILGADTRATDDRMVADKDCEKIHCIAPNVWCCGAGTSADLEALTRAAQYNMALITLHDSSSIGNTITPSSSSFFNDTLLLQQEQDGVGAGIILQPISVSTACRFLRNELYKETSGAGSSSALGVNLILGGYDIATNTARLTAIHPHGSMDVVPYAALGSGGLAAMAVLETRYRPNMTKQEGIDLVKDAVLAGIENDLGSGSQVDLCILGSGGVDYQQGVVPEPELEEIASHEERIDEAIASNVNINDSSSSSSGGVNGFGNLPFAVNSRRIIASARDEAKRMQQWSSMLGL